MFTKEAQELAKPCYEAIKKISKGKWEWKPEVGEWCIGGLYNPHLIVALADKYIFTITWGITFAFKQKAENYIPLLHWERIEEILEGMGYEVQITKPRHWSTDEMLCDISKFGEIFLNHWNGNGKTRQEAVMQAVIELGKESSNEKD